MKKILKILLITFLVFIGLIAAGLLYAYLDAFSLDNSKALYNISIPNGDIMVGAYLAEPEDGEPKASILMIHEWWGLREDILEMAEDLAEEGYRVLAVDTMRGNHAASVPGAIMLAVNYDKAFIRSDIDAAFAYLRSIDSDAAIGAMGFCFGGREAMHLGSRNPDIDGLITLYGSGLFTSADQMGSLGAQGPVLGIFGEDDASIPLEEVALFESSLREIDREIRISIYEGVGHAFVQPETIANPGAAQDAWAEVKAFWKEIVQN
jgi:carboxymethylenebutenolidase